MLILILNNMLYIQSFIIQCDFVCLYNDCRNADGKIQNVLKVACLLTFRKICPGNPLVYFNVIRMMTAARRFPVGSGFVSSLTTAVYPCQNEISCAAYCIESFKGK